MPIFIIHLSANPTIKVNIEKVSKIIVSTPIKVSTG